MSALMDSSAAAITQQSQVLLGANYFRVTVPLAGAVALDDTSAAAYATMDASLERRELHQVVHDSHRGAA